MGVNVKNGNNTLTGVEKFQFESATTAGTYIDFVYETGNTDISTLNEYDVTGKATARISATERAKIIPANIASGTTILGVQGEHSGGGTYAINTTNVTNGSASGATMMPQGQGTNVVGTTTITPSSGYYLPADVTVTNCSYTWNPRTGKIAVHSPTGAINITAQCSSTRPILKGDILSTPLTSSDDPSDSSTWHKVAVINRVNDNGTIKLAVVPLTQQYYDEQQMSSIYECPDTWYMTNFMKEQYNSPYYYYNDMGMTYISHPYETIADAVNGTSQSYSPPMYSLHSSFRSALTSLGTVTQYQYPAYYDPSSMSPNGIPDISQASTYNTSTPAVSSGRMFDIQDLITLFDGFPEYSKIQKFFWKNWKGNSGGGTPIYMMSPVYSEYMSNPYIWVAAPPYYYSDGMSYTYYDGYWSSNNAWDDPSYSSLKYFTPLFNVNLSNLTYSHTGTSVFDYIS